MKLTRDILIERAYHLYLLRGYSEVSISTFQEELGIGRASLYYYFKDKESLFKAVIDRYYVQVLEQGLDICESIGDDLSVSWLIEHRMGTIKRTCEEIEDKSNWEMIKLRNFILLLYTYILMYADGIDKWQKLQERSLQLWQKALVNDMARGILRRDVDVKTMARLLYKTKAPFDSNLKVSDVRDISKYISEYRMLYQLICV